MIFYPYVSFLLVASFAAIGSSLIAQPGSTAPSIDHVSLSFTLVGWDCDLPKVFFNSADNPQAFAQAYSFQRSKPYTYRGPAETTFLVELPAATSQQEPGAKTPGSSVAVPITFPTGVSKVLVLMNVSKDGGKTVVVPDDEKAYPPGHARIWNFYPGDVVVSPGIQGERGITLKPRTSILLPSQEGVVEFLVSYYHNQDLAHLDGFGWTLADDDQIDIFMIYGEGNYVNQTPGAPFKPLRFMPLRPLRETNQN